MWRARRAQAALAEEIETHRRLIERRLHESGMSPADAARESRRRMGNVTLAHEDARAQWVAPWIDSVVQDIAYALRLLHRAPGFAAAMIVVMALGIGTTAGTFSLVDGLMLKGLPVREPSRLVYFARPAFSYPIFQEVRARSAHVFSSVVAWDMDRLHVAWTTELEPTEVLMASGDFYSTLGIAAVVGRTIDQQDDRIGGGRDGLVAVLSYAAWQRRFRGDPAAIGRALRIEERTFTIVGVTPEEFFGVAPGLAPEITIPLTSTADAAELGSPATSSVHLLARLRDGIRLGEANAALTSFWPAVLQATTSPDAPPERRALFLGRTTALESARTGYSRVRNQFQRPLWLLLGLTGLLLAVASASAANLLLARGLARQREIAVRLAIGASRRRLVRQMFTESLVWTLLAAAAGLLLAYWSAGLLVSLMTTTQEPIVLDASLGSRLLGFTIALALATSATASVFPALRITALGANRGLRDSGQIQPGVARGWPLGRSLATAQMALTVMLVFGAALFVRSLGRVLEQDAGVERDGVIVLATDATAAGYSGERLVLFYEQLHRRLADIPGVRSASLSMYPPITNDDGMWTQSIAIDGNPVPAAPGRASVFFNSISPGYFRTVGIRLIRGRDFLASDVATSPRIVIVNEALARQFFAGQDPVGRHVTIGRSATRQDLQVVGLVGNAKYQRLQEEQRSIAYLPWRQHPADNLFAEVLPSGPLAPVAEAARREVRALDGVVPLRLETVGDRIRESLVTERALALLASALALAAVVLACAALYGLLAYAVSTRTREICVRLALGAVRSQVLRTVIADSMRMALVGTAIGTIASLWLGRFAATLLFQVPPHDPVSLVAAAVTMLLVAAGAAVLPARRAARVDPAAGLRAE
jgi:predicted permease